MEHSPISWRHPMAATALLGLLVLFVFLLVLHAQAAPLALEAFVHQVEAQEGKQITFAAADLLLAGGECALDSLDEAGEGEEAAEERGEGRGRRR